MNKLKETYYKVISKDNKAQNGGDFDYTPYLPKQKKDGSWVKGKWTPEEKMIPCLSGYHITKYWNMWSGSGNNHIYEVEFKDSIGGEKIGVETKLCCSSIRLIKKINPYEFNTGDFNTGNKNTGSWNTGDYNTEDYNSGNNNTGDFNSGDRNSGSWNTGDYNTGNYNSGNKNTGDYNTGNYNSGDNNTGNYNSGDRNTGNYNAGHYNTGNWNTGNNHTGYFNTKNHKAPIMMFGKIYTGKIPVFPDWLQVKIPTKECWLENFKKASKTELIETIKLPKFNYKIFEEITGITKKMFNERLK